MGKIIARYGLNELTFYNNNVKMIPLNKRLAVSFIFYRTENK